MACDAMLRDTMERDAMGRGSLGTCVAGPSLKERLENQFTGDALVLNY